MTTIEVMRKALEALDCLMAEAEVVDSSRKAIYIDPDIRKMLDENRRSEREVITALRAEIERLEGVEPVAWGMVNAETGLILDVICPEEHAREPGSYTVPLYTAPIAPAIPALTPIEIELIGELPEKTVARWAYALAAERACVQIK